MASKQCLRGMTGLGHSWTHNGWDVLQMSTSGVLFEGKTEISSSSLINICVPTKKVWRHVKNHTGLYVCGLKNKRRNLRSAWLKSENGGSLDRLKPRAFPFTYWSNISTPTASSDPFTFEENQSTKHLFFKVPRRWGTFADCSQGAPQRVRDRQAMQTVLTWRDFIGRRGMEKEGGSRKWASGDRSGRKERENRWSLSLKGDFCTCI